MSRYAAHGLSMGPKARQNAARKTGQQELIEHLVQEEERNAKCRTAELYGGAAVCGCAGVITFRMRDGKRIWQCEVHGTVVAGAASEHL